MSRLLVPLTTARSFWFLMHRKGDKSQKETSKGVFLCDCTITHKEMLLEG